jgi:hypothetical protein
MPSLRILCYNGSLVIWKVVSLTTAKFKPLISSVSGFALFYAANVFILMILYDFCLSSAQFCYIIVCIWKCWRNGCWSSLYSLGTDLTEDTASNSPSLVACLSVSAITWRLLSHCLSTDVFTKPFPSNGCLYCLQNYCFQQICHNM